MPNIRAPRFSKKNHEPIIPYYSLMQPCYQGELLELHYQTQSNGK